MALGAWRSASGWRRLISVQRRALPLRPAVLRAPFAAHITLPPPTAALVGSRPRGLVPAARFGTASNTTNNDPSMPAADGAEPGQLPAAAFTGLGFDQEFTPVLADMGVRQPTPIQVAHQLQQTWSCCPLGWCPLTSPSPFVLPSLVCSKPAPSCCCPTRTCFWRPRLALARRWPTCSRSFSGCADTSCMVGEVPSSQLLSCLAHPPPLPLPIFPRRRAPGAAAACAGAASQS